MLLFVWFLPVAVLISICTIFGASGMGIGLGFMWLGLCVYQGAFVVRRQEYVVIERLGKFHKVYLEGWHMRCIGIDTVRGAIGDLRARCLKLYTDEGAVDLDFSDGSAPIDASIWYQIGNPEDIKNNDWEKVKEAIKAWTYAYEKPEERLENLVDGELRPLLQVKSVDDASKDRNGIADTVMQAIVGEMAKTGAYPPSDDKQFIIEDIKLPETTRKLRELVLEGKKRAEESTNEAKGYWKAIKKIQKKLGVTPQEARGIYETQRGLRMFETVKPSLTLVGKDLANVLISANLGNNSGGKP